MKIFSFISLKYGGLVYPARSVVDIQEEHVAQDLLDKNLAREATTSDISMADPIVPESSASSIITNPPARKGARVRRASVNPE